MSRVTELQMLADKKDAENIALSADNARLRAEIDKLRDVLRELVNADVSNQALLHRIKLRARALLENSNENVS